MWGRKAKVAIRRLVGAPAVASGCVLRVVAMRAIVRIRQAQRIDLGHNHADVDVVCGAATGVACAATGLG